MFYRFFSYIYSNSGLCRQGFGCAFFSHSVGRHDKKDVDGHTHDGRDRRTAANDQHQADDGEYKRGLCFARVLSRTAGQNSFREGKAAHDEHRTTGHKHEGTGYSGFDLVHGNSPGGQKTAARKGKDAAEEDQYTYKTISMIPKTFRMLLLV